VDEGRPQRAAVLDIGEESDDEGDGDDIVRDIEEWKAGAKERRLET